MFNFNDSLQGTEIVARQFVENVIPKVPELKDYNWILVPGISSIDDSKNIAWIHLNETEEGLGWVEDPRINNLVFVSNYQHQRFFQKFNISEKNCAVVRNAIVPIEPHKKPGTEKIKLIYTSDTVRGADVAIIAMDYLSHLENIELHIYGEVDKDDPEWRIPEQQEIKSMAKMDERIFVHGMKDHNKVIEALKNSHIYVYPAKWMETSCVSLIEALAAGCYAITSNIGALSETGLGFNKTYPYSANRDIHARRLAKEIEVAVEKVSNNYFSSDAQVESINNYYSWENRISDWKAFSKTVVE